MTALNRIMMFKKITYDILLLLFSRRKKRDFKIVESEYEDYAWFNVEKNLENFIRSGNSNPAEFLFDFAFPRRSFLAVMEKIRFVDSSEYYRYKANKLNKLSVFFGDSILEIGSGFGSNLMALRISGYRGQLFGIDISDRGVNIANQLSNYFNLELSIKKQDILKLDMNNTREYQEVNSILIYQVIEQIPNDVRVFIQNLLTLFPSKKFFIIESLAGYKIRNFSELITSLYIYKQNYQSNLIDVLIEHEEIGSIRNLEITKYKCSHKFGHESALITFDTNKI